MAYVHKQYIIHAYLHLCIFCDLSEDYINVTNPLENPQIIGSCCMKSFSPYTPNQGKFILMDDAFL